MSPLVFAAAVSTIQSGIVFLLTALAMAVWKLTRLSPARWALFAAIVAILVVSNVKFWEYFDVMHKTGVKGVGAILAHRRGDR